MKKFAILVLMSLWGLSNAAAIDPQNIRMGVKASPTISWIRPETRDYRNTGVRIGYSYGLIADIKIAENYAFSTGFNVTMMGGHLEYEVLRGNPQAAQLMVRRYHLQFVEIPLTVKMHTQEIGFITYYAQIGFGAGMRIRAKSRDHYPEGENVHYFDDDIAADVNLLRGALIIGGGIKYSFGGRVSLLGGLTFNNGFSNILKGTNAVTGRQASAVQNYVELTIGLMF